MKVSLEPVKDKDLKAAIKSLTYPTVYRMELIAAFAKEQVHERFNTFGLSGGKEWADNWLGNDKHYQKLWNYFKSKAESKNTGVVYCWHPYSAVQEYGTKGKGGKFNTIRPKKAKALFIPLSDKARDASVAIQHRSARIMMQPDGKVKLVRRLIDMTDLKKGRMGKDGLEVLNPITGKYEPGIPDFIFLMKTDIPPRPMLPTSDKEKAELGEYILEVFSQ